MAANSVESERADERFQIARISAAARERRLYDSRAAPVLSAATPLEATTKLQSGSSGIDRSRRGGPKAHCEISPARLPTIAVESSQPPRVPTPVFPASVPKRPPLSTLPRYPPSSSELWMFRIHSGRWASSLRSASTAKSAATRTLELDRPA